MGRDSKEGRKRRGERGSEWKGRRGGRVRCDGKERGRGERGEKAWKGKRQEKWDGNI